MRVFFYGLFMDETVLTGKGIKPSAAISGFVNGFRLCIGERATLIPEVNSRAYGLMMDITTAEAGALYADESVTDYLPEPVIVDLPDGSRHEATCYILPGDTVSETSREYADALLDIATRLEFPDDYLEQIRQLRA